MYGSRFKVQGLGFGVRCSGFGVEGSILAQVQVSEFSVLGKTNPHGSQRMECDSSTVKMKRDHSRTSTSVGTVAEKGEGKRQPRRCQVRTFQVVVGTMAILSGLPRFAVWLELLQRYAPKILQPRWSLEVHPPDPDARVGAACERVARLESNCSKGELPGLSWTCWLLH